MLKEKELAKNTLILFIGLFATKIIQYLLLPLYTYYLNASEYGIVELFNTLISLLIPIISLQIEHGIFRFLISNRNNFEKKKEIISSAFFFNFIVNIFCILIFILLYNFIHNQYKIIFLIALILNNFATLIMQISRGLGNNKSYSISSFVISFFTIIFNIFFITCMHYKAVGMMYGCIIGYFIGIVYLIFSLKIYSFLSIKCINKDLLKQILIYSLPMIPNSISWWIFSSSDRIIVSQYLNLSSTGILAIAYKFSNIIIILYNVFNMSLTESISLHIDESDIDEYYNKIYNNVGNVFVSIGTILIAFMPIIFKLLINPSYNDSYNLIPLALISTSFQVLATMLGTIYIAKKNTKSLAVTSILAALINILTDIVLIRYIGIYAAVVSTVISYLVLFIYRIIDIKKKYFSIKINQNLVLNIVIGISIICSFFYINNLIIKVINIILAILTSIYFNKNNINYLKKAVLKK